MLGQSNRFVIWAWILVRSFLGVGVVGHVAPPPRTWGAPLHVIARIVTWAVGSGFKGHGRVLA